jgi:biopolymer transport protein ExbD
MAEIEIKKGRANNRRLIQRNTRVDLTPMVDLGFLLLTFFVFTTVMTEAKAMKLDMPYDKTTETDMICESCALTVILDEGNRIKYYEGKPGNAAEVKETGFGANEIRKVIVEKKAAVQKLRGKAEAFTLIIKSAPNSSFKNFVDITDEATICAVTRYYIDELNGFDRSLIVK